jgi:hypothetical protein
LRDPGVVAVKAFNRKERKVSAKFAKKRAEKRKPPARADG